MVANIKTGKDLRGEIDELLVRMDLKSSVNKKVF
jgi:hypothetical protein